MTANPLRTAATLTLTLILMAGCTTTSAQNSALLGTLAGSTLGALTFKNKISGAAIGGGAGMLVGYIVGNEMDKYDRNQVSQTLETMPSGQAATWVNPDTRTRYQAIPEPPRQYGDGRIERDVTLQARMPDGRMETIYAKAYRQPDGTWQMVQ
jgi:surface antigen